MSCVIPLYLNTKTPADDVILEQLRAICGDRWKMQDMKIQETRMRDLKMQDQLYIGVKITATH